MSSDIEIPKQELQQQQRHEEDGKDVKEAEKPKTTIRQKMMDNWQIGIKILEVLISAVCVGFVYEPIRKTGLAQAYLHHVGIIYTSYAGTILINGATLLGRLWGDRIPFKTSMIFSVCSASLYLISAILLIADRSYLIKNYLFPPNAYLMELLIVANGFTFVNMFIFIVDAVFTYRRRNKL